MQIENIARQLRLMWRADRILANVQLQAALTSFGLKALAALAAGFGLLMFEVAGYFALVQVVSAIMSALLLGAINIVIAGMLFTASVKPRATREIVLAQEVHDAAIAALLGEAKVLQQQVCGVVQHPIQTLIPVIAAQLVGLVLQATRKQTEAASPPPTAS